MIDPDDREVVDLMNALDTLIAKVPVEKLRVMAMWHEANEGKLGDVALPSGMTVRQKTRIIRLWIDFIDDWRELHEPVG